MVDTGSPSAVQVQYEEYPYPPRDPRAELTRLIQPDPAHLDRINYYCFAGERDFSSARILDAGGGTGDATIFLAEQLKATRAEIVYLDISASSMAIAKERAAMRQLGKIRWHQGSILDLERRSIGEFDFIHCSGVLHHLASPSDGLKRLRSCLAEDGAVYLMLYGRYGRTGVYQMQELMRLINGGESDPKSKIRNAKAVLSALPASNWFKRGEELVQDHREFGDAGIYDLFLHSQDRAYSVPEIYELLAQNQLHFAAFANPVERQMYEPRNFVKDPQLLKLIESFDQPRRQAVTEAFAGVVKKHGFYATAKPAAAAAALKPTAIPFFFPREQEKLRERAIEKIAGAKDGRVRLDVADSSTGVPYSIGFAVTPCTRAIFQHLDGQRTVAQILESVRKELGSSISMETLQSEMTNLFRIFNATDLMLSKEVRKPRSAVG